MIARASRLLRKQTASVLAAGAAWIVLLNVATFVLFGILNPAFLSAAAVTAVMASAGAIIILTVGQAVLLASGHLDISVGANVIVSSVVAAQVMNLFRVAGPAVGESRLYQDPALAIFIGLIGALLAGGLFGFVNGLIVTRLKVNALIATLGTFGIGMGLGLVLTNGSDVHGLPRELNSQFGNATLLGVIPLHAVAALLIAAVVWVAMYRTKFGIHILAIGSNRSAADRAGISVNAHIVSAFTIVGALCGFVGFIDIARLTTTNLGGHQTDALASIAGAVIGGTSLFGGSVSVIGAVFGGLFAVLLVIGFIVQGIPPWYNLMAVGAVLIAAVMLDQWRRRPRPEKQADEAVPAAKSTIEP